MTRNTSWLALLFVSAFAAACDGPSNPADSGTPDAGDGGDDPIDSGPRDAGLPDGSVETAPIFRNAVDLPDAELATQALEILERCSECPAITRPRIRELWDRTDAAWRTCLTDLEVETQEAAQAVVDCVEGESGTYAPSALGVFASGASLGWFRFVFRRALGDGWETEYDAFRAAMHAPPEGHPALTQAEFDLLTEWFLRGTPMVEVALPHRDDPGECTPYVDASVVGIVADGAATGWSARNREAGILMHGCAGAASPLDCLSEYPRASETSQGALWETPSGTSMRILFEVPYQSSFWTKSSADGRFVAHGGNDAFGSASIIDLQRQVVIPTSAEYDPGFFPDNSGFMFQGTPRGAALCNQSVLTTGEPTQITFSEAGCSTANVELYQHLGAALDGADYWIVDSEWDIDPGDDNIDPPVTYAPGAWLRLHRLTNTAGTFMQRESYEFDAPYQSSAVISPTMRLVETQIGAIPSGTPIGYVLRRIDVTRDGDGSVTDIEVPEVARYCYPGGKAAFSLDDRWLVTHHRATDEDAVDLGFTGPDDPGFAAYRGISNVYLVDLASGERHRVTNMQPGQRALFPHFRSDGWLYFLVRTGGVPEYVVATDAGIVLR